MPFHTVKHEYHWGQVYAMAGGARRHSQITGNVYAILRAAVRGSGRSALTSDMKIRQSPNDYVYADAMVTCDPRDAPPDQEWIAYPTLVVEVLSRSTARHDRGDKLEGYQGIATLREYVLIEYRRREVEVWRLGHGGEPTATVYRPGDSGRLSSVDLALTMDVIYEDSGL